MKVSTPKTDYARRHGSSIFVGGDLEGVEEGKEGLKRARRREEKRRGGTGDGSLAPKGAGAGVFKQHEQVR